MVSDILMCAKALRLQRQGGSLSHTGHIFSICTLRKFWLTSRPDTWKLHPRRIYFLSRRQLDILTAVKMETPSFAPKICSQARLPQARRFFLQPNVAREAEWNRTISYEKNYTVRFVCYFRNNRVFAWIAWRFILSNDVICLIKNYCHW